MKAILDEPALFVPLDGKKTQPDDPYWRFARGSKTVEVRRYGRRWNEKNVRPGRPATLSRGYSTPDRLHRRVGRVVVGKPNDLPEWAKKGADLDWSKPSKYFAGNDLLICFEASEVIP